VTVTYPWLEITRQQLVNRQRSGQMAHAFLLAGPKGLGKLELAQQVVAALLCLGSSDGACGTCRSCRLLASGAHPDFRLIQIEVNPKTDKLRTEVVIEQIRDLSASMQLTNSISARKVALVYPAEAMNRLAANALLKTLEEPPGDAVLLLVSHDPARLPATIRSRCQVFHVRLPDAASAMDWLTSSLGVEPEMAQLALQASAGSPLVARQLLADGVVEQFSTVGQLLLRVHVDEVAVVEALDLCASLDPENLWTWLSLIAAENVRASLHLHATGRTRQFSLLQSLADRNRRLMATPLRKELLLRDWLIQWSRVAA
jgi:DNA polymerase-3 subunit delta'